MIERTFTFKGRLVVASRFRRRHSRAYAAAYEMIAVLRDWLPVDLRWPEFARETGDGDGVSPHL